MRMGAGNVSERCGYGAGMVGYGAGKVRVRCGYVAGKVRIQMSKTQH